MVLSEYIISTLTTICICGSIFIINNHCIKIRETADENKPKYVILTQEAYDSITQTQPLLQECPHYELKRNSDEEKEPMLVGHPPPNYNEIDTNIN
jgi:hypothetical protein